MPVRVGFVGAGGMATAHMNVLQAVNDAQIVAIADIIRERAESAASRFVAKPYCDYKEMLENEKLDALYVCVPPHAHEQQELLAVEKGIHLFVEKPIEINLDKARLIRDKVRESGLVTAVGYHWRYQTNADRARDILSGRDIGMVMGYWMGGMPSVYWWRRMELSGGQMVDQTTHIFDLARFLCGNIREVYAAYATRSLARVPDFNISDVGTATLKFESGVVGTISNTCMLSVPYTVGLHIVAKDLVLEIHGDLKVIEPGHTETFSGGENPMLRENEAFIHAVKTGDTSNLRSTYEDAVKTLATTLACNESALTGKPVIVAD